MESSSLGALKNYAAARQALKPDGQGSAPELAGQGKAEGASKVAEAAKDFAEVFNEAEATAQQVSTGNADAHSVVEALAKAEVALETAVTIRNRVVEAYQELLRMPV